MIFFFLEIRLLSALKADIECFESRYRANKKEIHLLRALKADIEQMK